MENTNKVSKTYTLLPWIFGAIAIVAKLVVNFYINSEFSKAYPNYDPAKYQELLEVFFTNHIQLASLVVLTMLVALGLGILGIVFAAIGMKKSGKTATGTSTPIVISLVLNIFAIIIAILF